jgi:hypothetical protein
VLANSTLVNEIDIRVLSQRSRYVVPTISDKRGWLLVLKVWGWPALQCTSKLDRLRRQYTHSECRTCPCIIDFPFSAIQDGTVESALHSFANSTYPSIFATAMWSYHRFQHVPKLRLYIPTLDSVCIQNEKRGDLIILRMWEDSLSNKVCKGEWKYAIIGWDGWLCTLWLIEEVPKSYRTLRYRFVTVFIW